MYIAMAALAVIVNCIVYFALGSLVCARKDREWSVIIAELVGFFVYYGCFFLVCLPIMLTYRPLSLLSRVWLIVVILLVVLSCIINHKAWQAKLTDVVEEVKRDRLVIIVFAGLLIILLILVTSTYNFTLDAAYYVANVTTSVDTNMINVYDPFTGMWQDHFELRYVFATYSINDAVICQLMKLPALIQTRTVMSAVVVILSNAMYYYICRFLGANSSAKRIIMHIAIVFINLTFITLYTSSNFYMTRTYEGKSVVGNISVILIFVLYMVAVRYGLYNSVWFMLFCVCFGTATISSTANMIIPAEFVVLFGPYLLRHKRLSEIYKLIICILPEIIMMLVYVLYVKGYFAVYTYPR